jgi:hypothetical protein
MSTSCDHQLGTCFQVPGHLLLQYEERVGQLSLNISSVFLVSAVTILHYCGFGHVHSIHTSSILLPCGKLYDFL